MLILATFSGLQDYLFDIRESGGGQARSLRFRSFRIQLNAECAALRLLDAAALPHDRLLFRAAAKVCIDARDLLPDRLESVIRAGQEIQRLLLRDSHGRLRFHFVIQRAGDSFCHSFQQALKRLVQEKAQPFRPPNQPTLRGWLPDDLIVPEPYDPECEAERDSEVGRQLVSAQWLSISRSGPPSDRESLSVLGLSIKLTKHEPVASTNLLSCSNLQHPEQPPRTAAVYFHPRRLARHIPRDQNHRPLEFLELARRRRRGAAMLGVLKADVDSLGTVINDTLATRDDPRALRGLSQSLDCFFAQSLEEEKARPDSRWADLYTIFSGGDDLLAVGPWDLLLDFAAAMRELFEQKFGKSASNRPSLQPLTLSAGLAIIKPRYPVHLAAKQADELLDRAKSETAPRAVSPKDQCASLGQVWKWQDHRSIVQSGSQLADWVDAGIVERGWLHTLLELVLLRRGEALARHSSFVPELATSRLVYHVSRNWPKPDDPNPKAAAARRWMDQLCGEFDRFESTTHIDTLYLPAILRYALLATRSDSLED